MTKCGTRKNNTRRRSHRRVMRGGFWPFPSSDTATTASGKSDTSSVSTAPAPASDTSGAPPKKKSFFEQFSNPFASKKQDCNCDKAVAPPSTAESSMPPPPMSSSDNAAGVDYSGQPTQNPYGGRRRRRRKSKRRTSRRSRKGGSNVHPNMPFTSAAPISHVRSASPNNWVGGKRHRHTKKCNH